MFTGIIEEVGTINQLQQQNEAIVMKIEATTILKDINLGDSISVNGVCLTVTSFDKRFFSVDVMPETVRATSLRLLQKGSKVNLERAMAANGRFGGHFVSGHVDGIGTIQKIVRESNAVYFTIEASPELIKYIVYKGSITIDGTSLTVFGVDKSSFLISIIPHTLSQTIIGQKAVGDIVNIECDLIGKYIEQFITKRFDGKHEQQHSSLSESFLKDHGFM